MCGVYLVATNFGPHCSRIKSFIKQWCVTPAKLRANYVRERQSARREVSSVEIYTSPGSRKKKKKNTLRTQIHKRINLWQFKLL